MPLDIILFEYSHIEACELSIAVAGKQSQVLEGNKGIKLKVVEFSLGTIAYR